MPISPSSFSKVDWEQCANIDDDGMMSTVVAKICLPECNHRDGTSAVLGSKSKGACISPTHLQHVPSKFLAIVRDKFLKLIDAFPPQTKIAAYIKT